MITTDSPSSLDLELTMFLADPGSLENPHDLFRRLREVDPVHRTAQGRWMLTRYADAVQLFRDSRFSRQAAAREEYAPLGEIGDMFGATFSNLDGHAHRRIRQRLQSAFTPSAIESLRPLVSETVQEVMSGVRHRDDFDLLRELAYPIPERVICRLLGVPIEDHEQWSRWASVQISFNRAAGNPQDRLALVRDSMVAARTYFVELVGRKRRHPTNDLVSQLVRTDTEDPLTDDELAVTLSFLVGAGHETTANLIGNGMFHLLSNPSQWALLTAQPELAGSAVEEFLRFEPSARSNPRLAVEDIEIGGHHLPAGSMVFTFVAAVNRDPAKFASPDTLDITRSPNEHMAFATGGHFCLGAPLARLEAQVAFEAIARELPDLELASVQHQWRSVWVRSLESLAVHRKGTHA